MIYSLLFPASASQRAEQARCKRECTETVSKLKRKNHELQRHLEKACRQLQTTVREHKTAMKKLKGKSFHGDVDDNVHGIWIDSAVFCRGTWKHTSKGQGGAFTEARRRQEKQRVIWVCIPLTFYWTCATVTCRVTNSRDKMLHNFFSWIIVSKQITM